MKIDDGPYDADGKLRNGPFRQLFKDGSVCCEGRHAQGEKTGEWRYYLLNGALKAVGRCEKGKMAGEWSWYRENEELMQTGSFDAEEKKSGAWRRYQPDGTLLDEVEYVAGKKVGK